MNHFGVKAGIVLAIVMLLCSCSEKNPIGPGGQPELFFNWLPALLADQASAQPCHELMQFLDNASVVDPWASKDRQQIQSIVDRLGNCPAGRTYSVTVHVTDDCGLSTDAAVRFVVPHEGPDGSLPAATPTFELTPQEAVPFLGKPLLSTTSTPSGSPNSAATWRRSSAMTASSSQAPAPTKCCTGLRVWPA